MKISFLLLTVEELKSSVSLLLSSIKGFIVMCAFFFHQQNSIQCVFILFFPFYRHHETTPEMISQHHIYTSG